MDSSTEPRATIIAWALLLILVLVGAGIIALIWDQWVAGALMLSTACACLTFLARPSLTR